MSQIIDTEALNTYTGKSLNAGIAEGVVAAVNEFIETRTGRFWGGTTSATERYDFKSPLWLRHMDVVSVESLTLGYPNQQAQETLDSNGYWVNPAGRLTMYFAISQGYSVRNNDLLQVSYTYGVETVPVDLTQAALAIAARLYDYAINDGKDVVNTQVGSYRVESIQGVRSAGTGPNPSNNTADLLFGVIDGYKMRRF